MLSALAYKHHEQSELLIRMDNIRLAAFDM